MVDKTDNSNAGNATEDRLLSRLWAWLRAHWPMAAFVTMMVFLVIPSVLFLVVFAISRGGDVVLALSRETDKADMVSQAVARVYSIVPDAGDLGRVQLLDDDVVVIELRLDTGPSRSLYVLPGGMVIEGRLLAAAGATVAAKTAAAAVPTPAAPETGAALSADANRASPVPATGDSKISTAQPRVGPMDAVWPGVTLSFAPSPQMHQDMLALRDAADRKQFAAALIRNMDAITVGEGEQELYVFFDPYCGFCHRLYAQVLERPDLRSHWIPVSVGTRIAPSGHDQSLAMAGILIGAARDSQALGAAALGAAMHGADVLGVAEMQSRVGPGVWQSAIDNSIFFLGLATAGARLRGTPMILDLTGGRLTALEGLPGVLSG